MALANLQRLRGAARHGVTCDGYSDFSRQLASAPHYVSGHHLFVTADIEGGGSAHKKPQANLNALSGGFDAHGESALGHAGRQAKRD